MRTDAVLSLARCSHAEPKIPKVGAEGWTTLRMHKEIMIMQYELFAKRFFVVRAESEFPCDDTTQGGYQTS